MRLKYHSSQIVLQRLAPTLINNIPILDTEYDDDDNKEDRRDCGKARERMENVLLAAARNEREYRPDEGQQLEDRCNHHTDDHHPLPGFQALKEGVFGCNSW